MIVAPAQLLLVTFTFVLAGFVKGVTGMGLPTIAIGLLGLSMAPAEAAALLVVPSLITNVWQFAGGPNRGPLLRRMWPMLFTIFIATWAAAGLIAGGAAAHAVTALGSALVLHALISLARVRISVTTQAEPWLSPVIGAMTGLVTGATGVFVIPAVPYLQALDLEKEDLIQVMGLTFTASTIALAAGLASYGAFQVTAAGTSVLCVAPALAGMFLGQWIRQKVDSTTFRLLFFIGLLGLGADLIIRSI
jgi:uncharacterized protein